MPDFSVDTAAQIAQTDPALSANKEPGFANTYKPYSSIPQGYLAAGVPLLGTGALGLLLMYKRHQEEQERKKLKTAAWQDIKAQLPGVHPKDMLLGAAAGGGAGLLYDLLATKPEDKDKANNTLRRALTGAAIGGLGANVLGDRVRRYTSNVQVPLGYTGADLTPKSFSQFSRAFFADKPAYDPKTVEKLLPHFEGDKARLDDAIHARRELIRRSFGVHSNNEGADYWQQNKGTKGPNYYSLNEKAPEYLSRLSNLFLPKGTAGISAILKDPAKTIPLLNKNTQNENFQNVDMFGANTLLGDQQVAMQPAGKHISGRVLDRWDVTPTADEKQYIWDAVTGRQVLNPKWYGQQVGLDGYSEGQTNKSFLGNLLGRLFWDNVLTEEHPWVSQRFRFAQPDQRAWQNKSKVLQLMNESGAPQLELSAK
jgi:hypothetical protein